MRGALLVLGGLALGGLWVSSWRSKSGRSRDARFATRRELTSLHAGALESQRVPLGVLATGRWRRTGAFLAAPEGDSVLVLGPTRSGKTSSIVIPALLSWEGPVLAASVKDDLVVETASWRRSSGAVGVLEPSEPSRPLAVRFDPVALSSTFADARAVSADLCGTSGDRNASDEMAFWSQLSAKLLSSLLLAAFASGGDLETVATWIDRRDANTPFEALEAHGAERALDALCASLAREERQLGSVYATLESIVEPLRADLPDAQRVIDPAQLLRGSETLYLCAPAHDQRRFRPLFTATTNAVLRAAFRQARAEGGRLAAPLLVVLDEAAAIAPLEELDVLAATCSSHGITLVTCFQDLAQISARYAERATTVVNNHRTRVVIGGLADQGAASMLGTMTGTARDKSRRPRSSDGASERRALIEPHELRGQPPFTGIVVSGRLRAARLSLVPFSARPALSVRAPRSPEGKRPRRLVR